MSKIEELLQKSLVPTTIKELKKFIHLMDEESLVTKFHIETRSGKFEWGMDQKSIKETRARWKAEEDGLVSRK